jgi:hypothetical protein
MAHFHCEHPRIPGTLTMRIYRAENREGATGDAVVHERPAYRDDEVTCFVIRSRIRIRMSSFSAPQRDLCRGPIPTHVCSARTLEGGPRYVGERHR